jgi:hypothetical protein
VTFLCVSAVGVRVSPPTASSRRETAKAGARDLLPWRFDVERTDVKGGVARRAAVAARPGLLHAETPAGHHARPDGGKTRRGWESGHVCGMHPLTPSKRAVILLPLLARTFMKLR